MKAATFFWTAIPKFLVFHVCCPFYIFVRYWDLLGQNNNISSMVTIWWVSIKRVVPDVDIPATLSHSCRGSGGGGVMTSVTDSDIVWFDIFQCSYISRISLLVVITSIPRCRCHNLLSSSAKFLVVFVSVFRRLLRNFLLSLSRFPVLFIAIVSY